MADRMLLDIEPSSIFDAASPQAERIRELTRGFGIAATAVFLLVTLLVILISVKYRAKDNPREPKQIKGNRKLEILMVGAPLSLVIVFFFWSIDTMNAVLPVRGDRPADIIITGHQWFWEAVYPAPSAAKSPPGSPQSSVTTVSTANEIHLPTGRKLLMQLNTADVIHDWWVPALGGKMDMIPGMNNYLWVTIDKPGIYDGACSEFCGQQHAWMRIRVIAQSPDDYNHWLSGEAATASVSQGSLARTGAALFLTSTCGDCHRVKGTVATGGVGPDLTHFASRQTMLTGMMLNDSANLFRWLADPQKIKPGAHMPRFIFAKDSLRALTAYLEQLK